MSVKVFILSLMLSSYCVATLSYHNNWIDYESRANECRLEPNGTLINDPSSCAAYFLCVGGTEFSLNCPAPLQFNTDFNFCDTEANVQCEEPEITTPNPICIGKDHLSFVDNEESCDAYFLCFNEIAIGVRCPPPLHFDPEINDCNFPDDCVDPITPPPPSPLCVNITDGTYINDESSCAAYFVCLHGMVLERDCPDRYFFNPDINLCDLKANVDCEDPLSFCDDEDDFSFVNNPDGCADYYVCVNGTEIPAVCPHPLLFNADLKMCDFPENVNCTVPNLVCVDLPNGVLVNDNSSCAAYFFCINDQAISANCPDPFHFDPVTQICINELYSTCMDDICLGMPDRTAFDNPTSCASYYLCINQEAFELFCPEPLHFNPETNACDFQDNVNCTDFDPNLLCRDVPNMQFVPNPYSCAHFYNCINGLAFSGECPPPWLFNSNINACDRPENVDCSNITTTTTTTTTPTTPTTPENSTTTDSSTITTTIGYENTTITDNTTITTTIGYENTTITDNTTMTTTIGYENTTITDNTTMTTTIGYENTTITDNTTMPTTTGYENTTTPDNSTGIFVTTYQLIPTIDFDRMCAEDIDCYNDVLDDLE